MSAVARVLAAKVSVEGTDDDDDDDDDDADADDDDDAVSEAVVREALVTATSSLSVQRIGFSGRV